MPIAESGTTRENITLIFAMGGYLVIGLRAGSPHCRHRPPWKFNSAGGNALRDPSLASEEGWVGGKEVLRSFCRVEYCWWPGQAASNAKELDPR